MTLKRLGKKLLKITGIILGIFALLLVAFHIWFVYHAKALLEETVAKQSGGKIKLKIEKLRYNYFSQKMILDDAVFFTTDTLTASSAYRFRITQLRLKLRALLPLLLDKKLLIDSLTLLSPDIQVTTLRYSKDTSTNKKEDISIPFEMGKIYKSIQDGLRVLKVNRFQIYDGTFILENKADPTQLPLRIGKIDFHIDNLQVDTAQLSQKDKILFSDNIVLKSTDQHIIFPDGRHSLSFKKFRINLRKQIVQFDSCTIAANRKDSTGSSFRVFFDSLLLTHIDFDTLYRTEVIKADSVYCINPAFSLYVELGSKDGKRSSPPKLENIIEQLTGNLQLGYVGVKNGDFNIRTTKDGKPSSFISRQNNFDMQGLKVDQSAKKPIQVKSFAMAIRNYENFIRDSSYRIKFDSILFRNDRITLSNFIFHKLDNGRIINTFSVPSFSLEGLSWDNLVFEKRVKARLVAMYQPHISYTSSVAGKRKKENQSLFQSLGAINEYMDLEQLDITDGDIDLHLKNNLQVQLNHATLSVQSNSLLTSTRLSGIRNSLTNLDFTDGHIRAGDLLISLDGIRYTGSSGQLKATHVAVSSAAKNMDVSVYDAAIQKLQADEFTGDIYGEGIDWTKGNIHLSIDKKGTTNTAPLIHLKNIKGKNTAINSVINHQLFKADLSVLSLDELLLKAGNKPVIVGLSATGKDLVYSKEATRLSIKEFHLADKQSSVFTQLHFTGASPQREVSISIPSIRLVPHIAALLNGEIILNNASVSKPVIDLRFLNPAVSAAKQASSISAIRIDELNITSPAVQVSRQSDKGLFSLQWNGGQTADNTIYLKNLSFSGKDENTFGLDQLRFNITDCRVQSAKGKIYSSGNGSLAGRFSQLHFMQKPDDNPEWSVLLEQLAARNLQLDSIGKNNGQLSVESIDLAQLHFSDDYITKLKKLAGNNKAFRVQHFSGRYEDALNHFRWYNTGFSRIDNMFSLDSFFYHPVMSRDSFLFLKKYQADYLTAHSGSIKAGPLQVDEWFRDSILHIPKTVIQDAFLSDYKDRSKPFNSGLIKPLPADLLKKIPVKLLLDTVQVTDAAVDYTEVHEKTKVPTTIPVKRMTLTLYNVKNTKASGADSLRIHANGYLLDTVWVRLRVKQSYVDSLGGFLMTVRLKPGDLRVLNPVLIPMASVKLLSGELDTLNMRAVGREYMAFGEMKMFYNDLRITILKRGTDSGKTILTRLMNFFVNTFVIRRNNHSRTGDVFFIRQRDRSAINYLIKITVSGMASSVGAKNNKKMLRRYNKDLEKRKLPPIDLD